jgi:hypothetical protein
MTILTDAPKYRRLVKTRPFRFDAAKAWRAIGDAAE